MRPGDPIPVGTYAPLWCKQPMYVHSPLLPALFVGWLYVPDGPAPAEVLNTAFAGGVPVSFEPAPPGDRWRLLVIHWGGEGIAPEPLGWVWGTEDAALQLAAWSATRIRDVGWVHDWRTSPPWPPSP